MSDNTGILDNMSHMEKKKLRNRQRRMEERCCAALTAEAFFIAISPTAASLALLAGVFFWLWRWNRDPEFHFRRLPYDVPVFIFIIVSAVSVFASPDPAFSFYNYYHLVGAYAGTYFLAGQTLRTEAQLRRVLKALGWSAFITVLYGFYQFSFDIDPADVKWVDADAFPDLKRRVFSTWENPNIFAGYLGEAIAFVLAFLPESDVERRRKIVAALVALSACLAMTYARGACLAVLIVASGYGAVRERRILAGVATIGVIFLLLSPTLAERIFSVFTKIDTSSEMRLAIWESSVAMIMDHPLVGIGWGAYWMVYPEYDFYINDASVRIFHAHNMYLNYAAEIGAVGAAAFFWLFFGTMITAFRASVAEENTLVRRVNLGWGLALLTVALGGITDDVVFNFPTSLLLWMGFGLSTASHGIFEKGDGKSQKMWE